ncbi:MAG: hypothetical protein ACR2LG_07470 [Actinomycetota bacterium]|nr:low molecular weight phosphatase family protein [Actinomycetota bacterium]
MLDVTFICTGNRCRSPLAEAALARFVNSLPLRVSSGGTLDLGAEPSTDEMIAAARDLGLDLVDHRSRHLSQIDLRNSDLILGFELNHIAAAVVDGGASADKVFYLREIVRLLEGIPCADQADPEAGAKECIRRAAEQRSFDRSHRAGEGIPDPFGRSERVYAETAGTIVDLCRRLVVVLFGAESA